MEMFDLTILVLIDLGLITLAASAVIDVWRNGDILADVRAYFEARDDVINEADAEDDADVMPIESVEARSAESCGLHCRNPLWVRFLNAYCPDLLVRLLVCSYCMSHHVPWLLMLCYMAPAIVSSLFGIPPWIIVIYKIPLYSLAVTRLITLCDSLLPETAKFERDRDIIDGS